MAKFTKKVLGTVAGAVGDVCIKTYFDTTYVSTRPSSYKTPMDEVSVAIRDKFTFITKLSGAVNNVFWLRYIWKNSKARGYTVNNKVFSVNYPRLNYFSDIKNMRLLPLEEGFDAKLVSFSLSETKLKVTTSALGEDSGIKNNKRVSLQGILFSTEPTSEDLLPYSFVPFYTDDIFANEGEELNFESDILTADNQNSLQPYKKTIIVANLITKDKSGQPKNASVNLFSE